MDKIIYFGEHNENMPFVCQCVVGTGSNQDSLNGISHFIEHYIIHVSSEIPFFSVIKIHGYTGFYFTCYYWYVNSLNEGVRSFNVFNSIIKMMKDGVINNLIFQATKVEILDEIEFRRKDTLKTSDIISSVMSDKQKILMPIGNTNEVQKIESNHIKEFMEEQYRGQKIFLYVYDRKNNIYSFVGNELYRLNDTYVAENRSDNALTYRVHDFRLNEIKTQIERETLKISFPDPFYGSHLDIAIGEIFIIHICSYLIKKYGEEVQINYDKFFVDRTEIYFVISIHKLNKEKEMNVLKNHIINFFRMLLKEQNCHEEFYQILTSVTKSISTHEVKKTSEDEIRNDLINYAVLSYPSFNLLGNKEDVVKHLEELSFEDYAGYVLMMNSKKRPCIQNK